MICSSIPTCPCKNTVPLKRQHGPHLCHFAPTARIAKAWTIPTHPTNPSIQPTVCKSICRTPQPPLSPPWRCAITVEYRAGRRAKGIFWRFQRMETATTYHSHTHHDESNRQLHPQEVSWQTATIMVASFPKDERECVGHAFWRWKNVR